MFAFDYVNDQCSGELKHGSYLEYVKTKFVEYLHLSISDLVMRRPPQI